MSSARKTVSDENGFVVAMSTGLVRVAAALTAPFWEDRILGHSEMARLPIRCLWIATGNNPEFSNEMARRLVRIRLDPQEERPWQRTGFRHPDLMTWVRANRSRLVAACLTLCQAWIAAGKPHGQKTIGSFETWAQVIGGVLGVAGIPGFLGNLEEMMEASDTEGAVWKGFVASWWERFGTAEVGTADLFDVALSCDPPPPMNGSHEQARRTSFGSGLGKMRERMFRLGDLKLRVVKTRISHKATLWKLVLVERKDASDAHPQPKVGEPLGSEGNLENRGSPVQVTEIVERGEPGEPGEPFSTLTHTRTRAHAIENPGKGSPGSPGSPSPAKSNGCAGEPSGEPLEQGSPGSPMPDWLREVMD